VRRSPTADLTWRGLFDLFDGFFFVLSLTDAPSSHYRADRQFTIVVEGNF
jgi:hypothetical protein